MRRDRPHQGVRAGRPGHLLLEELAEELLDLQQSPVRGAVGVNQVDREVREGLHAGAGVAAPAARQRLDHLRSVKVSASLFAGNRERQVKAMSHLAVQAPGHG
jgi:hypothetical protein